MRIKYNLERGKCASKWNKVIGNDSFFKIIMNALKEQR